jgi:subtilisin family serine protease
VIGVAASDKNDDKRDFSNFGSACTDLAAPGEDIFSTSYQDISRPEFSDFYSGGWAGTSLAAPMVAGAASLLKAFQSSLSPAQILTILQLSVDPLRLSNTAFTGKFGAGRLNIARALEIAPSFSSSTAPATPETPATLSLPSTSLSPVTGQSETVSAVTPGEYIRSPSFSTVYFVTTEGTRRPFLDVTTFRTHATFDQVKVVTDATLPLLTLGAPMLPKPGVVLVKIQSDPSTYWVGEPAGDGKPILRLIPSESEAIRLFGALWADYVVDVPVTAWRWYAAGPDVGSQEILPTDGLKTRDSLN